MFTVFTSCCLFLHFCCFCIFVVCFYIFVVLLFLQLLLLYCFTVLTFSFFFFLFLCLYTSDYRIIIISDYRIKGVYTKFICFGVYTPFITGSKVYKRIRIKNANPLHFHKNFFFCHIRWFYSITKKIKNRRGE